MKHPFGFWWAKVCWKKATLLRHRLLRVDSASQSRWSNCVCINATCCDMYESSGEKKVSTTRQTKTRFMQAFIFYSSNVKQCLEVVWDSDVARRRTLAYKMGCGASTPAVEDKKPETSAAVPAMAAEKSVAEAEAAEGREKREESIVEVCLCVV